MNETPQSDPENVDQNELADEELTDVSGGNDPANMDFSSGELRSSMTGWKPPKRGPF